MAKILKDNKVKIICLLTCLFIAPHVQSTETSQSAGFGLQYGGVLGYQISSTKEKHNLRGALGLVGASVGYDYMVTDHFSVGTTATFTIRTTTSLNFNYYPEGNISDSWQIGVDFGHMSDTDGDGFFATDGKKNVIWLSLGYRF